jgi:hypothetical protein
VAIVRDLKRETLLRGREIMFYLNMADKFYRCLMKIISMEQGRPAFSRSSDPLPVFGVI